MIESASFVAAAMSLASRQLGHIEQRQNSVTLELYQYTIRLLISQDPNKADATVLATCALLCVYEMMASGVSEWRRHLKLPAGKTTLVPTDFWMDDMSIVSAAADGDTENYCNLAILVFAKIVNLLATFSLSNRMSESEPRASMTVLWNEFQEWYQLRPKQVYPLLRSDYTPSNTLPNVAFTQSSPGKFLWIVTTNRPVNVSNVRGKFVVILSTMPDASYCCRQGFLQCRPARLRW
ncbi:unnamed protein product [Aspergillus oryzae]|uniref:Unnamed protein product n=2 Tax=Aspergillus oryzae TaxID=5062 RepID=A0AAN5C4F6_ASPOZ|nr:unnamed protein product [Aspergillus oryzae]GMF94389.1 unnamed protein product [Aspergillus oryzae]GMG15973.1 unnamed protein product [Aspergillus oryzae]GMG37531.1 unnamed protein product [Aspergillus oryzae]GMG54156.1 unnamed protein product [Aspergillus oryzae var. brunneus]